MATAVPPTPGTLSQKMILLGKGVKIDTWSLPPSVLINGWLYEPSKKAMAVWKMMVNTIRINKNKNQMSIILWYDVFGAP